MRRCTSVTLALDRSELRRIAASELVPEVYVICVHEINSEGEVMKWFCDGRCVARLNRGNVANPAREIRP